MSEKRRETQDLKTRRETRGAIWKWGVFLSGAFCSLPSCVLVVVELLLLLRLLLNLSELVAPSETVDDVD